jgi:PKD repeat protein
MLVSAASFHYSALSISTIAQVPPGAATRQNPNVAARRAGAQVANPQVATALTLAADNLNPTTRQSVHFTATWNSEVSGVVYVFDWGGAQTTNSTDPKADHIFSEPGVYTVHVTAKSALQTFASRTPGITSNDVVINVARPPQKGTRNQYVYCH